MTIITTIALMIITMAAGGKMNTDLESSNLFLITSAKENSQFFLCNPLSETSKE